MTTVWHQADAYLPLPKFRADNANFGLAVLPGHTSNHRYFCRLGRNGEKQENIHFIIEDLPINNTISVGQSAVTTYGYF